MYDICADVVVVNAVIEFAINTGCVCVYSGMAQIIAEKKGLDKGLRKLRTT